MIHFIYRWKDPRNPDEILCTRYIGMTNDPNTRMYHHLFDKKSNTKKENWIRELQELSIKPSVEIIEVVYDGRKAAFERERYWIQYYAKQGCQLLNMQLVPKPPRIPKAKKSVSKVTVPVTTLEKAASKQRARRTDAEKYAKEGYYPSEYMTITGYINDDFADYLDDIREDEHKEEFTLDELAFYAEIYALIPVPNATEEVHEAINEWHENLFKKGGMLEGYTPSL